MRWMAVALLVACGGTEHDSLDGQWTLTLAAETHFIRITEVDGGLALVTYAGGAGAWLHGDELQIVGKLCLNSGCAAALLAGSTLRREGSVFRGTVGTGWDGQPIVAVLARYEPPH